MENKSDMISIAVSVFTGNSGNRYYTLHRPACFIDLPLEKEGP